jgi:hypothetical protein
MSWFTETSRVLARHERDLVLALEAGPFHRGRDIVRIDAGR